jgi:type IV pilus assembly protein PilW
MNSHTRRDASSPRHRQHGFTLIELMVSMGIAVFLLGGLLMIVQNTRNTFASQNQLAQLQDSERLAMSLIGDVIQSAGYYPDPTTNTTASAMPANAVFPVAGQSIVGARVAGFAEDTITIRYMTANNDGVINCTGNSNTSGVSLRFENAFSIDANGNLVCSLNGAAPVTLIAGPTVNDVQQPAIQNMRIFYGVQTNTALGNGAVDAYLRANEMTASNWQNIIAVKVILWFTNPLAAQPGQPPQIRVERVVGVMNRGGVKT